MRTTFGMRWRCVRSSAAMIGMKYGVPFPFTYSATARPVFASRSPIRKCTFACSTRRRAFCSAVSGFDASSSTITSIARPPAFLPFRSQKKLNASTISLPPEATTPVSGASSPMRIGPLCASASPGASDAAASAPALFVKVLRSMSFPPGEIELRKLSEHAFRREDHDEDEHQAEHERPALGIRAHHVLEPDDERGADQPAEERPDAADDRHQQSLDRLRERDRGGA